jgi:hypothetical protein
MSENVPELPKLFLKSTISELLPLTKEKNTSIKFAAEMSLLSLMKYGKNQNHYEVIVNMTAIFPCL